MAALSTRKVQSSSSTPFEQAEQHGRPRGAHLVGEKGGTGDHQ